MSSSEDAFSELQQEYLSFSNKSKYICLLGDFNARTATDTDFVDLIKNLHVDDYTALLLLSLLFKLTDNNICSGAWTSENNLLLSRISKSKNYFRSSGLVIQ
jgi:hypothetical protein